jgi:hypothetical protein
MKRILTIAVGSLALATGVAAQEAVAPVMVERRALVESALQTERARVTVESRITRGAPYSGEAVSETVQVLADGNRISRKSVTRIYRDSEGRTRREQVDASGEVTSITISDPVAESQYVLDPRARTAHRNGVIMATAKGGFAAATVTPGSAGTVVGTRTPDGGVRVEASDPEAARKADVERVAAAGAASGGGRGGGVGAGASAGAGEGRGGGYGGTVVYPAEVSGTFMRVPGSSNVTKEDLGQQVIEGVLAAGTRSTTTIPAGAIGNAQPIQIVSEQWVSEDLKLLVQTRHSDPRTGETTYRLTNVVQAEPSRTLFEVPADYTLRDSVIRRQSPSEQP